MIFKSSISSSVRTLPIRMFLTCKPPFPRLFPPTKIYTRTIPVRLPNSHPRNLSNCQRWKLSGDVQVKIVVPGSRLESKPSRYRKFVTYSFPVSKSGTQPTNTWNGRKKNKCRVWLLASLYAMLNKQKIK